MDAALPIRRIAERVRLSRGLLGKSDILNVAESLGLSAAQAIAVGDDCAAIPDGAGFTLFAIEGLMGEFVAADPWFAGWCAVMVNISDVAAMGGRPLAVVDALWAENSSSAAPVLEGLKAASRAFGVPIVGGHTNLRSSGLQLSAAIIGRATRLLTSFNASPGDRLVAAIDLRGRYREPFSNWEAATDAPQERLRGDLEILPELAECGCASAAKDISQGGILGTAVMLAECSNVAISIDLAKIPKPAAVDLERWLQTFPSFGYLISAPPDQVGQTLARFNGRGISAAAIGEVNEGTTVTIAQGPLSEVIWDHSREALMGFGPRSKGMRG